MLKVTRENKNLYVYKMLENAGAILEGHFGLTSGYHSGYYLQCAQLLMHPNLTHMLADESKNMLSESIDMEGVDLVISPAVGGILFGYMLAYRMGTDMIFSERKNGRMTLRRGFQLKKGQKVIIAEDVITTGGSVKEVMDICKQNHAEVLGIASIVDRSQGVDFHTHYSFLIQLHIENFLPQDCKMCRQGIPMDTPGSRT